MNRTEVQHRSSNKSYWFFTLSAVLILSILKLAHLPHFSKDAQYYIQSALLWPSGQVSFAGSLIGDRHLTVGFYSLFLYIFGDSIDSIVISLAFLYAIHSIVVVAIIAALKIPDAVKLFLAISVNLISFFSTLWLIPASEPPFTVSLALLVFVWLSICKRARYGWFILSGLSVLAGWCTYFRAGSLFFVIGIMFVFFLFSNDIPIIREDLKISSSFIQRFLRAGSSISWKVGFAMLLLGAGFWIGSKLGVATWRLWVPSIKPSVYTYALLFYKPILNSAEEKNGPISAEIYQEMDIWPRERRGFKDSLGYWKMLGYTYGRYGPAASEQIMRSIGVEALKSSSATAIKSTFKDVITYLIDPAIHISFINQSSEQQWEDISQTLKELDNYRLATTYIPDIATPVAILVDLKLPVVNFIRRAIPVWRLELNLPGILTLPPLILILVAWIFHKRTLVIQFLPFCFMMTGILLISAFSQGFIPRYSAPFLYLALIMVIAAAPDILQKRAQETMKATLS